MSYRRTKTNIEVIPIDLKQLTHKERCDVCTEAYKNLKVDALREEWDKARKVAEETHIAYLDARDAYYKIYREVWFG